MLWPDVIVVYGVTRGACLIQRLTMARIAFGMVAADGVPACVRTASKMLIMAAALAAPRLMTLFTMKTL